MTKMSRCWYKDCDSDNKHDPTLMFYKFPKDLDRCEKWVRNCSNNELTKVWSESPDRVAVLRVCQKHFLKEFLGSSSRLVGHAVPAPYGVTMDRLDVERFMVDCASFRSASSLVRQPTQGPEPALPAHQQEQYSLPYYENSFNDQGVIDMYPACDVSNLNNQNYGEIIADNCYSQVPVYEQQQATNTGPLMNVDQADNHANHDPNHNNDCQFLEPYVPASTDMMSAANELPTDNNQYSANYHHGAQQMPVSEGDESLVYQQVETPMQLQANDYDDNQLQLQTNGYENNQLQEESSAATIQSPTAGRLSQQENPKINYDREGRVISIQYSSQTVSLMKTGDKEQNQAHVEALKYKLRYYQRKLAVKNHRYQKLKSLTKGRSKKTRLLESLKDCKADFTPCIFEIFKRQIKGPSSRQGNRWSDEVKSFSSSIYLRSKCAYKFIRKSIDLPSESIVKRYIAEKNLSESPSNEAEDKDER